MSVIATSYPLVSIIIVTYNVDNCLRACLASISTQTYPALEVVIIDGASTDRTVEIISDFSEVVSFWISEPDEGIYDAMTKGLKYINGEWVYFLGADDELLPGFSELLFYGLKDKSNIYYGHVLINGKTDRGRLSKYDFTKMNICQQAIIYPIKVFKKYSYNKKYRIFADYYLNILCLTDDIFSFQFCDFVVAKFNHTGTSSTYIDKAFKRDESGIILRRFGLFIWFRYQYRKIKKNFFSHKEALL